jgi:PAS domain S-box-containing protein
VTNFSLKTKGLLLVVVPVLFQVLFVLVLVDTIHTADAETQKEIRSKNIIIYAQSVLADMYQAAVSVMRFRGGGDPEEAKVSDAFINQTRNDLNHLENHLQFEPSELKDFGPGKEMILKQLKGLAWRKSEIAKGNPDPLSPSERLVHYNEMGTIVEYFRDLADRQKKRAASQFDWAQHQRQKVENMVYAGIAINCIGGIVIALFFSTNILKRIDILRENAQRLARSTATKELIPPIAGTDEVAELDSVFHAMAAKLEEAMRKEKAVVDNAPDLICSLDSDGRFVRVNPAVENILGKKTEQLIGQAAAGLIDIEQIKTKETDGSEFRFESEFDPGSAEKQHISWTGQWSQEERSFFCIGRNITAQRQLEQFKQELMEMVSHDLRTPLTSIRTGMELILEGAYGTLSEKGMKKLDGMNSNISSLVKLVNDLLDLHKSEAGSLTVTKETSPVLPIIERSIHAVQPLAEKRKIEIVVDCAVENIIADADRLEQVLCNFLGNAVKFSPDGGTIKVEVASSPSETEFKVCDKGKGVPPDLADAIFERFRQVDPNDKIERKGTGLGLAIAKAIILAHDGSIGVKPNENGGSIFWFKIPV